MPKTVHLEDTPIGSARTWHEVAQLLSAALKRSITAREAQDNGSEGRDGFYITFPAPVRSRGSTNGR